MIRLKLERNYNGAWEQWYARLIVIVDGNPRGLAWFQASPEELDAVEQALMARENCAVVSNGAKVPCGWEGHGVVA